MTRILFAFISLISTFQCYAQLDILGEYYPPKTLGVIKEITEKNKTYYTYIERERHTYYLCNESYKSTRKFLWKKKQFIYTEICLGKTREEAISTLRDFIYLFDEYPSGYKALIKDANNSQVSIYLMPASVPQMLGLQKYNEPGFLLTKKDFRKALMLVTTDK